VPLGVVIPTTLDDVVATHHACYAFGAPIVNRGGADSTAHRLRKQLEQAGAEPVMHSIRGVGWRLAG
jgi:FAD/FMN-containing dehydrogenase